MFVTFTALCGHPACAASYRRDYTVGFKPYSLKEFRETLRFFGWTVGRNGVTACPKHRPAPGPKPRGSKHRRVLGVEGPATLAV